MKTKMQTIVIIALSVLLGGVAVQAQNIQATANNSTVTVDGTSNVHDWDINAEQFTATAIIESNDDALEIKKLTLNLAAESLKSGKGGMDKNTYKALNTKKNKRIVFTHTKTVSLNETTNNTYAVVVQGVLEIAGTENTTNLSFELVKTNEGYTIKGSKNIHMPDYNVTPPTAMLGTVKTGADVTINYNLNLK